MTSSDIAERRVKVKALLDDNIHPLRIAEQLGVHISTIYGDVAFLRGESKEGGSRPLIHSSKGHSSISDEQIAQIGALTTQGFGGGEIARKLGITPSVVYYHAGKFRKGDSNGTHSTKVAGHYAVVPSNGAASNNGEEAKVAYIFGRLQAELEHLIERADLPKAATSFRVGRLLSDASRR